MTKIKSTFQSISGIWTTISALNQEIYANLYINGSQAWLCNGKAVVNYHIDNSSINKISFSIISAVGCSQNEVLTALYKSYYYRW